MKKTLYSLLALATLVFAASCAKEPVNVADPAMGGKPVVATFSVNLGDGLTKADTPETSALDDGMKADQLYVGVFGPDGALISTSYVGENTVAVSQGTAEVKLTLTKNSTYQLVFFAQKSGTYDVNFADGKVATFAYTADKAYKANDAEMDAFYKTMEFTADGKNLTQSVELKRPFAQVNVFVPVEKLPEGKTEYASTMTVTGAPTSFDLFAGEAVEPAAASSITFANNAISADSFGKYAENGTTPAKWVAMNYVLVP
ncbi:MAG: hypothetical protein K5910_08995, partial [Bacteroidales bacterium]|nr:hypothetical protein [Bacteroidales bacterium]